MYEVRESSQSAPGKVQEETWAMDGFVSLLLFLPPFLVSCLLLTVYLPDCFLTVYLPDCFLTVYLPDCFLTVYLPDCFLTVYLPDCFLTVYLAACFLTVTWLPVS